MWNEDDIVQVEEMYGMLKEKLNGSDNEVRGDGSNDDCLSCLYDLPN